MLRSGDGYAEYVVPNTTKALMFGLSTGDIDVAYTDIDFAIYPFAGGGGPLQIWEGGAYIGNVGNGFAEGDVLRVAVEGGVVKYRKNGTLLYTSSVSPTYPLLVDTSFIQIGSGVLT
jgi:hypothetical protein